MVHGGPHMDESKNDGVKNKVGPTWMKVKYNVVKNKVSETDAYIINT